MVLKTYIMREKMCHQPKIWIATKILLPKYRIDESVTQLLWFCHGMKIKKFEWITNLYFINLLIIWLSFITMRVDSINIWEISCYFHDGMNTLYLYHILVIYRELIFIILNHCQQRTAGIIANIHKDINVNCSWYHNLTEPIIIGIAMLHIIVSGVPNFHPPTINTTVLTNLLDSVMESRIR